MRIAAWCFILCAFLQLCSARDLNCTVTQRDGQTTYNITDMPHISGGKASKCEYTWANETNHVLAIHGKGNPEVLRNNISTLVTSRCFAKIIHNWSCISEGTDYTSNCMVNCALNYTRSTQKVKEIQHPLIATIVVTFVVLLLVGLLVVLLYKFRDNLRKWSCSNIYTAVDPKAADVEVGNK